MMPRRLNTEAAERSAERRQRENDAGRLLDRAPSLTSLNIHFAERRVGGTVPDATHIRRVVVDHAPALFVVPCGDQGCTDGGHDLTWAIVQCLDEQQTKFEGEHACSGSAGTGRCSSVLFYKATATYR